MFPVWKSCIKSISQSGKLSLVKRRKSSFVERKRNSMFLSNLFVGTKIDEKSAKTTSMMKLESQPARGKGSIVVTGNHFLQERVHTETELIFFFRYFFVGRNHKHIFRKPQITIQFG